MSMDKASAVKIPKTVSPAQKVHLGKRFKCGERSTPILIKKESVWNSPAVASDNPAETATDDIKKRNEREAKLLRYLHLEDQQAEQNGKDFRHNLKTETIRCKRLLNRFIYQTHANCRRLVFSSGTCVDHRKEIHKRIVNKTKLVRKNVFFYLEKIQENAEELACINEAYLSKKAKWFNYKRCNSCKNEPKRKKNRNMYKYESLYLTSDLARPSLLACSRRALNNSYM